jgi:hypothetical protein
MKIREIVNALERLAPLALQESWDNAGLQVGLVDEEARGVLVSLDVTEQVAKAIAEYIKPKERPKYIIRISCEFLERMYIQNCADTPEEKEKLFRRSVDMIRNFLEADGVATTVAYSFIDENGNQYKSWELVEVEEGDPLLAVVEDVHGNILRRMDLKEKED